MVADAVSNEKGLEKGVIFEAIESALATATRKYHDRDSIDCRVAVDQTTGEFETFRVWTVLEEEDEEFIEGSHLTPEQAKEKDAELDLGDTWEEKIDNVTFGRIAAQTAKQVIVQKVREAEREIVIEEFRHRGRRTRQWHGEEGYPGGRHRRPRRQRRSQPAPGPDDSPGKFPHGRPFAGSACRCPFGTAWPPAFSQPHFAGDAHGAVPHRSAGDFRGSHRNPRRGERPGLKGENRRQHQ